MYTYIIIDDEEIIRKGTIKKISPIAGRVACTGEAENGKDGIELIERVHPDFVILDMQMPVMGGMDLLPYLNDRYPEIPLIVISGYRDFDYIKQAISANAVEYLLKPFDRKMIQTCVERVIDRFEQRTKVQNQILTSEIEKEQACIDYDYQLLYNKIRGYHTPGNRLTSKKFSSVYESHLLLLITLYFEGPAPNQLIQSWMKEHGFGELAAYISDTEIDQLGFILLFVPQHGSISDKLLAEQILDELLPWLESQKLTALAGVSNTHSGLDELYPAYKETSQALNQQCIQNAGSKCYFYSTELTSKNICWNQTDELLFRVEAGSEEEIQALINKLFLFYRTIPDCTLEDVKYHCYQIAGQCRLILQEYLKASSIPDTSSSMQNVIDHMFRLDEIRIYYLQFLLNLNRMIRPQSVYALDDVIEKICIYMQRNLQKNLTQDFIASLFYMNRSYLSSLFRKTTGTKFIDYLNALRIQRAAELLGSTDRKMYQISKAVGYDNVKYFFRIFKKKMGVTPEQYRREHQL